MATHFSLHKTTWKTSGQISLRGCTSKLLTYASLLFLIAMITACGSDAFQDPSTTTTTTTTTGTTGTTTGTGTGTGTTVTLGSGTTTATHVAGTLAAGVTTLSAGGTTTITAVLLESTGILYGQSATITFSSPCVAVGTASITSSVTTTSGVAIANYTASGCAGTDTVSATTTINGTVLTATVSLTIAAATVGSVQFISASPSLIALKGTGGAGLSETSTLIFKVIDQSGGPVVGEDVTFTLNTTLGGLAITPSTSTSGADGTVQTVVQAGTVSTAVRVTATVVSAGISTQSDQLVVSTGIPDQDSFSLSATALNPEGLNYDGETVTVTARLADRFNNPVPDGTAVSFSTEGGSIQSSCVTTDGACSVTWTSQNPRPCGQISGDPTVALDPPSGPNVCSASAGTNVNAPTTAGGLGQPYGGRATIIATAVGEESFIDVNGNGYFDSGSDTWTDLPEAWRDDNENGTRDGTSEIFYDFDNDGSYDAADGLFNGVLCNGASCATSTTLHIRKSLVLVMSGSGAYISINGGVSPVTIANGATTSITVVFSDQHNQPMPVGTTVAVTCSIGSIPTGSSATVQSTNYNGPLAHTFTWKGGAKVGGDSGACIVNITTPNGNLSTGSITVVENA